jgi:hypothetical protein
MLVCNVCEAKHEGNPRFKSFILSFLKAEKGHRKRGKKAPFSRKGNVHKNTPEGNTQKGRFQIKRKFKYFKNK